MKKLFICTLPNTEGYFACEKGEFNNSLPLGKNWDKAVKKLEEMKKERKMCKHSKTKPYEMDTKGMVSCHSQPDAVRFKDTCKSCGKVSKWSQWLKEGFDKYTVKF